MHDSSEYTVIIFNINLNYTVTFNNIDVNNNRCNICNIYAKQLSTPHINPSEGTV